MAINRDRIGGVVFQVSAIARAGKHQVDRQVYQPRAMRARDRDQVAYPFDIDAPSHRRVELAGPQGTVAGAIEHGAKTVLLEQPRQAFLVLRVARHDAWPVKAPIVALSNADHLARIALLEVGQRVVARHAGDAGDQQGQWNGWKLVRLAKHAD